MRLLTRARASLRHDLPIIAGWIGEGLCWAGAALMIPGSLVYGIGAVIHERLEDVE